MLNYNMLFKVTLIAFLFCISNAQISFSIVREDVTNKSVQELEKILLELQGYQVQFDYEGHLKEREKVYKYLVKRYPYEEGDEPIDKVSIGIDLYDLDDDGEKEILVYFINSGFCGSAGCSFYILKKVNNNYLPLIDINCYEDIFVLNKKINSHRSIALNDGWDNWNIWFWNRKKYDHLKKIIFDNNTPDRSK